MIFHALPWKYLWYFCTAISHYLSANIYSTSVPIYQQKAGGYIIIMFYNITGVSGKHNDCIKASQLIWETLPFNASVCAWVFVIIRLCLLSPFLSIISLSLFFTQMSFHLCLFLLFLLFFLSVSPFICLSRSLSLGLPGLSGLDDRLLPEGSPGLTRRQAAHVLQGCDHPDAVAFLHHRGEDCGLRPLRLRLPALLRHIHHQPLVCHMWPAAKKLSIWHFRKWCIMMCFLIVISRKRSLWVCSTSLLLLPNQWLAALTLNKYGITHLVSQQQVHTQK